jgi:hypothetical protein
VIDGVTVRSTEPERSLAWEAKGVRGTAVLEPSGWGTKVTLTAEIEQLEPAAARAGFWSLWRPPPSGPIEERRTPDAAAIQAGLEAMLEDLGSAHRRKPFSRG